MNKIIEIVELGMPKSIIQREGMPISELIDTDNLIVELNTKFNQDSSNQGFHNQLESLYESANSRVKLLIELHGEESVFSSTTCLKIDDENYQYNLDGGHYLKEITSDSLVDNHGYLYQHHVIDVYQYFRLIDHLVSKHSS